MARSYRDHFGEDPRVETSLQRVSHHQVDSDAEKIAEFVLQVDESEKTGRLGELDQDVQIAVFSLFLANPGAEEPQ
jgi:hypothetical protein